MTGAAVCQRGGDARGLRADLALFRPAAADRGRGQALRRACSSRSAWLRASMATPWSPARRAFAFDLTVPGGQVKAAGLTIVGVLPTHRRRGYLRGMMRSLTRCGTRARRVRSRCCGRPRTRSTDSSATAWPRSRPRSICRASMRRRSHAFDVPGQARLVDLAEAEPLVAPIYARVARETPGMFARTSAWWQDRLLIDQSVAAPGRRRAALRRVGNRRRAPRPMRSIASTRRSSAASSGRPYPRGRGDGRFAAGDACDLALPARHRLARARQGDLPAARSSAAAVARGAAPAEFPGARGPVGPADRCRRGAVGARLCDRR